MLRLLASSIFCFWVLLAAAGEPKDHYSPLGIGWSFHRALDEGMSPLVYAGGGGLISTGYFARNSKTLYEAKLDINVGRMSTRASTEGLLNRAWVSRTELAFDYLRNLSQNADGDVRWYAGGHIASPLNMRVNLRLGNSAINYDFLTSVGLSGRVEQDFKIGERGLTAALHLKLPLFSYALRPNFSGAFDINDQAEIKQDVFNNRMFGSINKVFRFNSRLLFTYPIKSGNLLQFGYEWDYYTIRTTHRSHAGLHSLVFSRTFKW